jgi:hypothetical protein
MINDKILKNLKTGDIGFCMNHDNLISKVIAWFMKSNYSHSFIIYHVTDERVYILETSNYEVVISTLDKYIKDDDVTVTVFSPKNLSSERRKLIVKECEKYEWITYGYLQLISLGIRRLLMRINIKIKNFIRHNLVCNQLVLYGYSKFSNIKDFKIDPESIDTQELLELVMKSRQEDGSQTFELVLHKGAKNLGRKKISN